MREIRKWRVGSISKDTAMAKEFDLLSKIVKQREITIGQLKELVPRKFGDHRDYYVVASLITGGYLECTMHMQGDPKQIAGVSTSDREEIWFSRMKEFWVARQIYSMTLGPGEHKYEGTTYGNPSGILDERVFPAAKAFLHFNSEQLKRKDQIITLAIGIIIGLVTAVATAFLTA